MPDQNDVAEAIDRIIELAKEQQDAHDRISDVAIGLIQALNDLTQSLPPEVVMIPEVEAALHRADATIEISRQVLAMAKEARGE